MHFLREKERNVLWEVFDGVFHVLVGSIVDDDVDLAHLGEGLLNNLLAVLLLGDVGRKQVAFSSVLLDLLLCFLGVAVFVGEVVDQNICALHGVENSNGTADTRVPSGNDSLFALKLAGCFVGLIAAIFGGQLSGGRRRAFHFRLETWLLLVLDGDLMAWFNISEGVKLGLGEHALFELRVRASGGLDCIFCGFHLVGSVMCTVVEKCVEVQLKYCRVADVRKSGPIPWRISSPSNR